MSHALPLQSWMCPLTYSSGGIVELKKNNIVMLLGFLGFIVMADNWVVSPILPAISENIGVAVERGGLLIAAYMIPFGIFQIVFGPLADRYGKKQVIMFSIILFTVATGLCSLGFGLTDLAIYRALTGIFAAAVMPISLALIGDIFPVEQRQGAIGTFMGISFLGQGLSMVTGGAIAYFLNWRGVFAIYALLSVIPMVMLIKNYKQLPDTKHADSKFIAPYMKLLADPKSLFTYILVLLEGLFIIGSFSYLGAFIARTHHFNYLAIGIIMTAFGFMTVVGGRLSGYVPGGILLHGRRRTGDSHRWKNRSSLRSAHFVLNLCHCFGRHIDAELYFDSRPGRYIPSGGRTGAGLIQV